MTEPTHRTPDPSSRSGRSGSTRTRSARPTPRVAISRTARRTAEAIGTQLDRALRDLDLRTWVVDTLRWHDWGQGREFDLARADGARLVEAEPGERLQVVDVGAVRVTSRRVTFIGTSQVRSVSYPQVVGWSRGETSLSLASSADGTVWHLIDVPDSLSLMTAVCLNLADSMLDDHVRTLDRLGRVPVEDYTEAFIDAEVAPAQVRVADLAARLEAVESGQAR